MEYLTSWKEIAHYLHSGVRTAQRYEIEFGLPVRRPTGKLRGAVVSTTNEIDAWMNTIPISRKFQVDADDVQTKQRTCLARGIGEMIELEKQAKSLVLDGVCLRSQLFEQLARLRSLIQTGGRTVTRV